MLSLPERQPSLSDVCPHCLAMAGVPCVHKVPSQVPKQQPPQHQASREASGPLSPDMIAALLKLSIAGAVAAAGYFLLRSSQARTEEGTGKDESAPEPETPFSEWEPNE